MAMASFRPASEADLAQVYAVFYENEVGEAPTAEPNDGLMGYFRHVLRTGTMVVAERDGRVVAFAGAVTRGDVAYLTDLFVRPGEQSAGLGRALLQRVMPPDAPVRCTCSSTDPRALSLYIRSGMRPHWPHVNLRLTETLADAAGGELRAAAAGVGVVEARADDPELARWDARVGGRPRPAEHAYWVRDQGGAPLWFRRRGEVVGYGYARWGAVSLRYPETCSLGPIGARTPEDSAACVAAAVDWARRRAGVLRIDLPGPHPALAPLLAARFQIIYVETFVSTAAVPFFDPRCYVASGSDLL